MAWGAVARDMKIQCWKKPWTRAHWAQYYGSIHTTVGVWQSNALFNIFLENIILYLHFHLKEAHMHFAGEIDLISCTNSELQDYQQTVPIHM